MKAAGCVAVSFGIESGCQDMLKRVKKGITLKQAREAVAACRETGMRAHASFMVGLPGESEESMARTRSFQEELGIEFGYHFLCPFPGTTVREKAADYDIEILASDWGLYDADSPVVRTSGVSPERMIAFVEECYAPLRREWDATKARVDAGEGTEEEGLQILGYRRMELIFTLLSEDLVEKCVDFPETDTDPLDSLVRSIVLTTGETEAFTSFLLKDLAEKNLICCRKDKDGIRWQWAANADSTPASPLPEAS